MPNQTDNKSQHGQILLFALFFMIIVLGIVGSMVGYADIQLRAHRQALGKEQALDIGEAGAELAIWKLNNQSGYTGETGTSYGNGVYTVTITSQSSSSKLIKVDSYVPNATNPTSHRTVQMLATTGTANTAFNYGVQVGEGGIDLTGSGTVNGNIYANGPITGDSSAVITGTAISADSPAITTDQNNGSGTPPDDVIFANANATQDIAQSFQLATSSPLNKIQLYIKKVGSPNDATVKIVSDSSGTPSTTVLASGTLSAASVGTSYGWINVSFSTNPELATSTTYWLVVDAATSSSKYYTIGANSGGYANGVGKIGQLGGTWNNTTPSGLDYYFNIFLGGVNGLIASDSGSQFNPLHIGTSSGTAQANTVNYTNSGGLIYCQNGTGNNKSCTAQADPSYVAFPISDANIADWEGDAVAGSTNNGDVSVGPSGATLGPEKIIGNLTVSGGGTLTVTGTLWVTGNITLDGGALIKLAASYGSNDGVLISDGTIAISGGGHATGSGTASSYIMMLSTSSSSNAMSVSGGAGAVIMYAANGTLNISGGASLNEATAYQISVGGGSSITYQSGLASSQFSSGPAGGWQVSRQSWQLLQ